MGILEMVDAAVSCCACGAKGVGTCNCWDKCPDCGLARCERRRPGTQCVRGFHRRPKRASSQP